MVIVSDKHCYADNCQQEFQGDDKDIVHNYKEFKIAWQLSSTTTIDSCFIIHKNLTFANQHHTSWCSGIFTEKGWSSDFPPLPSAFSDNCLMAFMLRSHNGVHCCGTVGDSHSVHYVHLFWPQHSSSILDSAFGLRKRSQLSAVKHTFTGNSY